MAVVPVDPGIIVPSLGSFPLSADQIYSMTFSALDSEEEDTPEEESSESDSENRKKMRERRKEARQKAKEQRKQAKEQAKEAIKQAIKDKLKEINDSISSVGAASLEITENTPNLLGQKAYLVAFDAVNIKPLEAQLVIMTAQAALGALPGTAPELAAADMAALAQQIAIYKDVLEYWEMQYQQKVAAYKSSVAIITVAVATVTTFCTLFKLTEEPSVAAFLATLNSVVAALNALVAVL